MRWLAAADQSANDATARFELCVGARNRRGSVLFKSYYGGTFLEYDYPKSESPIGSINFNAGGLCTKGARTFWATGSDEIAEFKAGGDTPIRVLKTSPYISGCAVDPRPEILRR